MKRKYILLIEESETGYAGYFPELPTILVVGDTLEETKTLASEAIGIYREEMELGGQSMPEPHMIAECISEHQAT